MDWLISVEGNPITPISQNVVLEVGLDVDAHASAKPKPATQKEGA